MIWKNEKDRSSLQLFSDERKVRSTSFLVSLFPNPGREKSSLRNGSMDGQFHSNENSLHWKSVEPMNVESRPQMAEEEEVCPSHRCR